MNGFIKLIGAIVISSCLGWCFFRRRGDDPPSRRRRRSPSPPRAYSRNAHDSYNNYTKPSPNQPSKYPLPSSSKQFSSAAKQPAPCTSEVKSSLTHSYNYTKQHLNQPSVPSPKPSPNKPSEYRPSLLLPPNPSQSSPLIPETPSSSSSSKHFSSAAPYTSEVKSSFTVKPTLRLVSSSSTDRQTKAEYIWAEKGKSPVYEVPENVESEMEQDKVPEVLRKPLSASSYKKFFAALLYAEDSYLKKWSEFQLLNVALELKHTTIYKKDESSSKKVVKKTFVSFEIDTVLEKRPFLLSRDFVFARLSDGTTQGLIYRVQRSTSVLVEFGQNFLSQHQPTFKYDVSFSFNRVCLKRFHQAIEVASDRSYLRGFIFPDSKSAGKRSMTSTASTPPILISHILDKHQRMAVHRILNLRGAPPYLVEGSPSVKIDQKPKLSRTGMVVKEAVLQLYQNSRSNRILICAPLNKTCDALIESLKKIIKDHEMFRVNAAFREFEEVPSEILNWSGAYEEECFTCRPLHELKKMRVIVSTFVSSFRLHSEGMRPGDFSHVFLVDASMVMEPEVMVAVGNLADEKTAVIVTGTGAARSHSTTRSVRSDIGRKFGLAKSYFERLRNSSGLLYHYSYDSGFISRLEEEECKGQLRFSISYLKAGRSEVALF